MTISNDRPPLYDYLAPIVDDVMEAFPWMLRRDVEDVVCPPGQLAILEGVNNTLSLLADEIDKEYGDNPIIMMITTKVRTYLNQPADSENGS